MIRLFVGLLAGLAVAAAIAFLNLYLAKSWFDVSTLVVFAVVPVGAILMAIPAAITFNFLAWSQTSTNATLILRGSLHLLASVCLGVATLGIYHYLAFSELGLLTAGRSFGSAYAEYFREMTMSSRYGDFQMNGWGKVLGIASYVGAGLGGLWGISGAGMSSDVQTSRVVDQARQVAVLAILLGMDGDQQADEQRACARYVTKLALDTGAERMFAASKKRAIASLDQVFAEAENAIPEGLLYSEVIDRCTAAIGQGDSVFNKIVIYGLAAVICRDTPQDLDNQHLIRLAYVAQMLGEGNSATREILAMGHVMRQQILSGKMK